MMNMPSVRVERSFRRNFHSYHNSAAQQALIAQQLVVQLSVLCSESVFRNGFEIGCGTGHLTRALHGKFSFDALTLNDLVPEARATAKQWSADFLPGDARSIRWPDQPDLIASASTIQWMESPADFVQQAARALAPGGWLAISGFGPDQYHELATLGSTAQAPGLCQPADLLNAVHSAIPEGFDVLETGHDHQRLWFETPQQVLKHLRQTGVNAKSSQVWTRAALSAFCDAYVTANGSKRGVPLTYHPVWIVAHKRAAR